MKHTFKNPKADIILRDKEAVIYLNYLKDKGYDSIDEIFKKLEKAEKEVLFNKKLYQAERDFNKGIKSDIESLPYASDFPHKGSLSMYLQHLINFMEGNDFKRSWDSYIERGISERDPFSSGNPNKARIRNYRVSKSSYDAEIIKEESGRLKKYFYSEIEKVKNQAKLVKDEAFFEAVNLKAKEEVEKRQKLCDEDNRLTKLEYEQKLVRWKTTFWRRVFKKLFGRKKIKDVGWERC